jgi:hypothetical protein
VNTIEGLWTTVHKKFLRMFAGVHKKSLGGYVAMCEFAINLKRATPAFIVSLIALHYLTSANRDYNIKNMLGKTNIQVTWYCVASETCGELLSGPDPVIEELEEKDLFYYTIWSPQYTRIHGP